MRILLVEDEKALSDALVKILQKNHINVDTQYDGEKGLFAAQSGIYDVIVLDVMLPKMSGFKVLQTIRAEGNITPVILLTAKSSIKDKVTGFDLGADDYITKPFQATELLIRIRAVSRRKGEIEDYLINYGDLCLNTKNCILSCTATQKEIQLSAKEYQMMEYLMKKEGEIISKESFITKVWGFLSEAEYNSVEVYISFLRKKLVFLGSKMKIKAIRARGYKLTDEA
ncbi:MAG: response regulator transcription factor [Clostridia bacterium]|nr:response regulator transcription factor [Clostridia bacterium]MCR5694933.1 response regulator transcription factor [Clostridia bacterium]